MGQHRVSYTDNGLDLALRPKDSAGDGPLDSAKSTAPSGPLRQGRMLREHLDLADNLKVTAPLGSTAARRRRGLPRQPVDLDNGPLRQLAADTADQGVNAGPTVGQAHIL
jgi:hypothetical protein